MLSCAGVAAARSRWAKLLAASWAPIVTFVVVATGNHYVFDALAGIAVTAAGFGVYKLTARREDVFAFLTHPPHKAPTRRHQPMITAADPRSATRFPLTRIVHLDDHVATRAGLQSLVAGEPDLRWIGGTANEAELWTLIRRTHPSLVMLDMHHPGRGGLELCAELKAIVPTPAVVIYTSEEHDHLRIAARSSAFSYGSLDALQSASQSVRGRATCRRTTSPGIRTQPSGRSRRVLRGWPIIPLTVEPPPRPRPRTWGRSS